MHFPHVTPVMLLNIGDIDMGMNNEKPSSYEIKPSSLYELGFS
jgi:hypothetical protein